MNRQPFVKLAFLVASTGYVASLAAVWILGGWVVAFVCALLGFVVYVVLQLELDQDEEEEIAERLLAAAEQARAAVEDERPRLRQPAEGTRGFDRIQ